MGIISHMQPDCDIYDHSSLEPPMTRGQIFKPFCLVTVDFRNKLKENEIMLAHQCKSNYQTIIVRVKTGSCQSQYI